VEKAGPQTPALFVGGSGQNTTFKYDFYNKTNMPKKQYKLPTFVIPMAPMFSLNEVVPHPLPKAPVKRHPIPSIPTPRLIACFGGGGAPDNLAQA